MAALRAFLRKKLATSGAIVILLLSLAALLAPVLPLDDFADQDYDAILASPGWSTHWAQTVWGGTP